MFWVTEGKPQFGFSAHAGSTFFFFSCHQWTDNGHFLLLICRLPVSGKWGRGISYDLVLSYETGVTRMWPSPQTGPFRIAEEEGPAGRCWSWSWEEAVPPRTVPAVLLFFLAAALSGLVPSPPSLGYTALTKGNRREGYIESKEHQHMPYHVLSSKYHRRGR